jgi:hypothetical protein
MRDIRPVRKENVDEVNGVVRKWGFEGTVFAVIVLVYFIFSILCVMIFNMVGLLVPILGAGIIVSLSKYLQQNHKKGIDDPIKEMMANSSGPKTIRQSNYIKEMYED